MSFNICSAPGCNTITPKSSALCWYHLEKADLAEQERLSKGDPE